MKRGKLSTARLLRDHRPLWRLVTHNPFVLGVREGSLSEATLERWLVQGRFIGESLFMAAVRVLAEAPLKHRAILVECLAALNQTLEGYDRAIGGRRFRARPVVQPASRALSDFVRGLAFEPYVCGIVSLWAHYRSYQHAVAAARTASPRFRRVLRQIRGVNVLVLEERLRWIADDLLANASPEECARVEETFVLTARHRIEYWAMILSP